MTVITFLPPDQGRPCDGCTACCDGWLIASVNGHGIGHGVACKHMVSGGCGIYETRPDIPCRSFQCEWKLDIKLPEWLKPNLSHVIMIKQRLGNFDYINLINAGDTSDRVFEWAEEYSKTGVNFIISETKQVISQDDQFKHFINLLKMQFTK